MTGRKTCRRGSMRSATSSRKTPLPTAIWFRGERIIRSPRLRPNERGPAGSLAPPGRILLLAGDLFDRLPRRPGPGEDGRHDRRRAGHAGYQAPLARLDRVRSRRRHRRPDALGPGPQGRHVSRHESRGRPEPDSPGQRRYRGSTNSGAASARIASPIRRDDHRSARQPRRDRRLRRIPQGGHCKTARGRRGGGVEALR